MRGILLLPSVCPGSQVLVKDFACRLRREMYGDSRGRLSEGQAAAGPVPWVAGQPDLPAGRGLGLSVDQPGVTSALWGVSRLVA